MSETTPSPVRTVAIVGNGLAAWLIAALLRARLPETVHLTVIGGDTDEPSDILYGTVLPPEIYNLHLSFGLDERILLSQSQTAFCYGMKYASRGTEQREWVQAFHHPIPPLSGVPVGLLLSHTNIRLKDILISAVAGDAGKFAHPPQDQSNPLSMAEYGYIIDASEIASLYQSLTGPVDINSSPVSKIDAEQDRIHALYLENGEVVSPDFVIDVTGPNSLFNLVSSDPSLMATLRFERQSCDGPDLPLSYVEGNDEIWKSASQTRSARTLIACGKDVPGGFFSDASKEISFAREDRTPWRGNCVSIGQAAGPMVPLTVAPMRRLLRDVKRLSEYFPVSTDMKIEARAYNSAAIEDHRHARLFQTALKESGPSFGECLEPPEALNDPKLTRKLQQYEERGYHVAYDHEPFDRLDWAILHDGLDRRPRRMDPLAASLDPDRVRAEIEAMRQRIAALVSQMPPHPLYIEKLLGYLDRKGGGVG